MVELMGGTIQVESEPDMGSTFYFTVQLKIPAKTEAAEIPSTAEPVDSVVTDGPRLNILLAEDNGINRLMTERIFRKRGHFVVSVSNGREAVEALEGRFFDVVLMDVQMPVMDGIEATKEIRNSKFEIRNIPVIALTAHTRSESVV